MNLNNKKVIGTISFLLVSFIFFSCVFNPIEKLLKEAEKIIKNNDFSSMHIFTEYYPFSLKPSLKIVSDDDSSIIRAKAIITRLTTIINELEKYENKMTVNQLERYLSINLLLGNNLMELKQVIVPDVRGMELVQALLELQYRELYSFVQLRFTNNDLDKGLVILQEPQHGTTITAGRRIRLVVSQGRILN